MTSSTLPAFPASFHDTRCFNEAFAEFREANPHFESREFFDLPLDDRCAILRVAQLKKDEARLTDQQISDGVIRGLQLSARCFDAF
jgi:hypothetical protein